MGDCNPACQKILLNGRLMGPAAKTLALVYSGDSDLRAAATRLHVASEYHRDIVNILKEAGALTVSNESLQWAGCAEASQIATWIVGPTNSIPRDAASKMLRWADDLIAHAAALIAP